MALTANDLAAELERWILNGRLAVGERLPSERKLSEQFGVSRPAVREALRTLAERHLVDIQPARGTFVTDGSGFDAARPLESVYRRNRPTVRQLVEAREMLEAQAATLAASRATSEDLRAIGAAVERMEAAADPLEYVRNDLAFHLTLVHASHNPVIETMFGSIAPMVVELMIRSATDPSTREESGPLHRAAYEAILLRDADLAAELSVRHQRVAYRTYGADIERPVEVMARRELARLLGRAGGLNQLVDDLLHDVTRSAARDHQEGTESGAASPVW
jgi:GntR family transcriptional regulator, transcriptional repressor for pyruvate dehydrogenase complex